MPQEMFHQPTQPPTTKSPSPRPAVAVSHPLNTTAQRVANLRHWCQQQHPSKTIPEKIPGSKLSSILVDEKHKMLFCQIPSVAINEWRKLMLILSGVVNTTDIKSISGGDVYGKYGKSVKRLNEFPDVQRGKMLRDFYKVLFVRDPLERLFATYMSKFVPKSAKYFQQTYGSQIIKKYRKGAKPDVISKGDTVKFSEFANYVIDTEFNSESIANEHWRQYYKQCHPCLVEYDYVGKFESLASDTIAVLDKIKARSKVKSPIPFDSKIIPQKELKKQYSTISAHTLSNLFKVYSTDFTLFGYKCPQYLHDLMEKGHVVHDY